MESNTLNGYFISITSVFFMIAVMGTRPLVPLLSNELGADPIEIGFIVAMFALLPFFSAITLGKMVDRIGCKKPIVMSLLLGCAALAIPFFYTKLVGIYTSQLIGGISQTLYVVAAQRFSGNADDQAIRNKNVMIFSVGMATGSFIGPLLGGYLGDWYGYPVAFGFLAMIGLASLFIATFLKEKRETYVQIKKAQIRKKSNVLYILRNSKIRKAFLISSFILLGKDIYTAYFPLLAVEFGFTNKSIGMIISINAVAGIFIRWFMPLLINRFGRNKIITGSIVSSGLLFVGIPLFRDEIILAILSFLLGMGLGLGQPLSIATTIESLPKSRVGEGLGLRLTFNRLTQLSAPIASGFIANFFGFSGVFWIAGFMVIIGTTKVNIREVLDDRHAHDS